MSIRTIENYPSNGTSERDEYLRLFELGATRTTTGNASSIDVYTLTIIKLSSTPTYTMLASRTKFA